MKATIITSTLAGIAFVLASTLTPISVSAAATATYSLSQSGTTVSIYENSSTAVNTVQANLSYSGAQPISVTAGSTFGTCPSAPTTTSIVCAALGGNITGTNLVATVSFASTTAASQINVLTSSAIYDSVTSTDDLNHTALPSLAYSYTVATSNPVSGGSSSSNTNTSSTGSSSLNTSTSPAKASTSNVSTTSTSAATAASTASTPSTGSNNSTSDKSASPTTSANNSKSSDNHKSIKQTSHGHWRDTAAVFSPLVLLAVLATGTYIVLRRRTPVVAPVVYKVGKKSAVVAKTKKSPVKAKATSSAKTAKK